MERVQVRDREGVIAEIYAPITPLCILLNQPSNYLPQSPPIHPKKLGFARIREVSLETREEQFFLTTYASEFTRTAKK